MLARVRSLLPLLLVSAGIAAPHASRAAEACPPGACITISGTVRGPAFEAVPEYRVLLQRGDGYNVTVTTGPDGRYAASVPAPAPNQCYQIVGQADAYYANSTTGAKQCFDATVNLSPKVRIQSVAGQQKTYLPDATAATSVPIQISALSRSYPAPFASAGLPWVIEHHDPLASHEHFSDGSDGHLHVHDHSLHHGADGVFDPPSVRQIAPGVWQYLWSGALPLDAGAGFYDMDWGRGTSWFDPMMECKMVWFGYGIDAISPSKALAGSTVTLSGRRFGDASGGVVIKGGGQVTLIEGNGILDWSDTSVTFVVPPQAKSGWVEISPASGVTSNAQHLELDPVKNLVPPGITLPRT